MTAALALSATLPNPAGVIGVLLLAVGLCVMGVAVVWEWKNRRDRK